jgi:hypothetical protein
LLTANPLCDEWRAWRNRTGRPMFWDDWHRKSLSE